jgi:hypothetical protein
LPLCLDLTNPSPARGWAHEERDSFAGRGPADAVLALALIHHLAIGNNLPFDHVAGFFRRLARHLVVEFVPKDDPQARRLLSSRPDIFPDYTQAAFEAACGKYFEVRQARPVGDDGRVLYLMEGRA